MKNTTLYFLQNELIITDVSGLLSIPYIDIVSVYCDRPYLSIRTTYNRHFMIQQSLSNFIKNLPYFFCQCNRSVLVNMLHVEAIHKNTSCSIVTGNDTYTVSRRRVNIVLEYFLYVKQNISKEYICYLCKNKIESI